MKFADAIAAFDDDLLALGASGDIGTAVAKVVTTQETSLTDVLALAVAPKAHLAAWTARSLADRKAGEAARTALERALDETATPSP